MTRDSPKTITVIQLVELKIIIVLRDVSDQMELLIKLCKRFQVKTFNHYSGEKPSLPRQLTPAFITKRDFLLIYSSNEITELFQ